MTGAAVLGSWPGADQHEAQSTLLGELTTVPDGVVGLPALLHLSDRGPWSEPVARTAVLLSEMPVELGPHGWKLADRPGRDVERLQATAREETDVLAVAGYEYAGPLVVTVSGPWTTAATLYLARGDRVLSDRGAVRELTAGLAEGLGALLATVRGAVPGAEPVVVLHEPRLADVLAGQVPDFSGHGRLWSVPVETARTALADVVTAARSGGARSVVLHGGGRPGADGLGVLLGATADAVGLMAGTLTSAQWEQLASAVEGGTGVWWGLPQHDGQRPDTVALARQVAGPWTAVGLSADSLADVVVHGQPPTGPAAGGGTTVLRTVTSTTVQVAARLAERAADA